MKERIKEERDRNSIIMDAAVIMHGKAMQYWAIYVAFDEEMEKMGTDLAKKLGLPKPEEIGWSVHDRVSCEDLSGQTVEGLYKYLLKEIRAHETQKQREALDLKIESLREEIRRLEE